MSDVTKDAKERSGKPIIGGTQEQNFERVDDFEFEIDAGPEFDEGSAFIGKVTDCFVLRSNSGDIRIKLVITLENGGGDYESLSILKYSPLKRLIAEVETDLGRKVTPGDLIGMWVKFMVKYNKGYWNLKTIVQIDEPEDCEG